MGKAPPNVRTRVTAENPGFAIVPYWVLARASGNAVKLYAVLRKYADNDTGDAYPSRATLAMDMGFKDPKSLTKLIKELERIGAIQVERRRLEQFVNHYKVIHRQPASSAQTQPQPQHVPGVGENDPLPDQGEGRGEESPRVGEEPPPGVGDKTPHELDPSLTRPTELEAPPLFEAPPSTAIAVKSDRPEAIIAKRAYDASKGSLKYVAMLKLSQDALAHGYTPQQVEDAMAKLWHAGQTIHAQSLGQTLQGIRNPGGPKPSVTEERVGSALDRAAQYRAAAAEAAS